MPTANGYAGARNATGLLVTAAVHVALGAALLTLGVVELVDREPDRGPIVTKNVPLPLEPAERVEPQFPADPVELPTIPPPVVDVAEPARPVVDLTVAREPVGPSTVGRGPLIAEPSPPIRAPEPVTVAPRLDPRFAARFQPNYPAASRRLDEEGTVLVRVRVGTDGRVIAAELLRSSGYPRLDEAAVAHARRAWRFVPATRDGAAVEGWREVPVRFELNNS